MTAKKRFLRKQKKWKAWGAAIAAEEILMDQEASILFPTMCDKLQKQWLSDRNMTSQKKS